MKMMMFMHACSGSSSTLNSSQKRNELPLVIERTDVVASRRSALGLET